MATLKGQNFRILTFDGDDWKAVTADGSPVEAGKVVRILKVDSVILTVETI